MKHILLIATGGTIASRPTENGLAPQLLADDILRGVPALGSLCRIDAVQPMNIDSTNMSPDCWLALAECLRDHYDRYDGFVITHGTDTMAYTALRAFLSGSAQWQTHRAHRRAEIHLCAGYRRAAQPLRRVCRRAGRLPCRRLHRF